MNCPMNCPTCNRFTKDNDDQSVRDVDFVHPYPGVILPGIHLDITVPSELTTFEVGFWYARKNYVPMDRKKPQLLTIHVKG
jgi:hypothetical protein